MKEAFFKQATETSIMYNFMAAIDQGCGRCTLSDHKYKPIVYRGNPEADVLLIGEAPGKVEQERGEPFVGPAGELLDNIMSAIGLDTQKDLCITNAVFCRPTAPAMSGKQNYTPIQEQLSACYPLVQNFIRVVNPKVIIACGRVALSSLSGDSEIRIGQHEGQWRTYPFVVNQDRPTEGIPMFVMTHPAAILHLSRDPAAQTKKKQQVWEYMQVFRDTWREKANGK